MARIVSCDGALFALMNAALTEAPTESSDAAEVQSIEGGAWDVHRGADGALRHLVRTDFGETVAGRPGSMPCRRSPMRFRAP